MGNAKVLLRFMMELCNANVLALTNKVVEDNKDKTAEPKDITEGKKEEDDEIMVIDTDPNNTDTQEATKESKEKDQKKENLVSFSSLLMEILQVVKMPSTIEEIDALEVEEEKEKKEKEGSDAQMETEM